MDSYSKHQTELGCSAVRVLLLVTLAGLAVLVSTAVYAQNPTPGQSGTPRSNTTAAITTVQSGPNGVTVYISVTQQAPGTHSGSSSATAVSAGSQRSCSIGIQNIGHVLSASPWYQQERAAHPDHVFGSVSCDDGLFAFIWIPMGTPTEGSVQVISTNGNDVDPVAIALELLNHLPIPDITIEANPSTGLVALSSWFWVDGYDGSPISSSDALPGVEVDVEIQPLSYRWSFGDGTTAETTSLGQRYPDESEIQHVYEQSSLTAGGAYTVTVEVTFAAQYRVNGGAWETLDPITRSFSNDYPVQQLQSVIVGQRR